MNFKQTVVAIIFALLIPIATLYFVEEMGYSEKIQSVFFGNMTDLGDYKTLFGSDYWKELKLVMITIAVAFIAYVIFYTFFFELIALFYFIISSKWRKPKIFISYKSTPKDAVIDTTKIALEVKKNLEKMGFPVLFLEYTDKLHHDNVNEEIKKMQKQSDALIAIPDPYLPSYVDNEISVAFNTEKPVFIIKHTPDQRLPNTANSGHTVWLLAKLRKAKFKPLSILLQYTHKMWNERLYIIAEPIGSFMMPFSLFEEGSNHYFKAVFGYAIFSFAAISFGLKIATLMLIIKILVTILGVIATFLTIKSIFKSLHFQSILKQSKVNVENSYNEFVEAGFTKEVLSCIDKVGLKID